MKERLWITYYWGMVTYLLLALSIYPIAELTWNDREFSVDSLPAVCNQGMNFLEPACRQGADTPLIVRNLNETLFFGYVSFNVASCIDPDGTFSDFCLEREITYNRYNTIDNYYPFFFVLFLTFFRWILVGKHIWQRP